MESSGRAAEKEEGDQGSPSIGLQRAWCLGETSRVTPAETPIHPLAASDGPYRIDLISQSPGLYESSDPTTHYPIHPDILDFNRDNKRSDARSYSPLNVLFTISPIPVTPSFSSCSAS